MNSSRILKPGDNCWRIEHADRVGFLVDGADYFHAFRETAKKARRSVLIAGWDVDSRLMLEAEDPGDGLPVRLGDFLDTLVSRRKRLHIHILDWDYSVVFAPEREWLPWYKMDWATHRRLHFRLDSKHPVGGSQHQKIVVIDDRVAFVGGLDFALRRWDTSEHRPDDPRRRILQQHTIPPPYHDVQMMVGGDVAKALGELVRDRWHDVTGKKLHSPRLPANHAPWPEEIGVDLEDLAVGIARTYPKYGSREEVREIERLLVEAIAAARNTIYIENQYFSSYKVGDALASRLAEEDGPEVVIVLPKHTDGWLTQITLDVLRERLIKRLNAADKQHRLRVYYPHVPNLGEQCINVHAKLLVVDEALLCVGSANFNNRSMGLDSECDLVLEANGELRVSTAIAAMRNRLLAEHLDTTPAAVAQAVSEGASLIQAIEALGQSERTLRPLELTVPEELDALVPDAQITDPEMPFDTDSVLRQFVTEEDKAPARRSLSALATLLVIALLLAATWRWTPLSEWLNLDENISRLNQLRNEWFTPFIVIAIYVVASLLVFPVTLLIIGTGLAFGSLYGFAYAMLGAEVSALVNYAIGHTFGRHAIRNLSNRWVTRISRQLAHQGVLAIVTLRFIPIAPFTVINLVAGASHIRLRDFALGTLLGMAPGILALTVFSDQVVAAITAPEAIRIVGLLVLAVVIAAGSWWFSRWLLKRQ